jgi:FMN phosphatase YigB (HAD superfamily)
MRPYFDPFVVSADLGIRKPRAEAFRAVLESWALPAPSVAMVGDSLHHDVGGANTLGLYSIHFTQIPNPFDPEHRGAIVPNAEAGTHHALRALIAPLLGTQD